MPSPRESGTSRFEADDERAQYPGGDDGDRCKDDPASIDQATRLQRAKVHLRKTACTFWDEQAHVYRFHSVWTTTRDRLGMYGVGVPLYFDLLKNAAVIFVVLTLLTLPLLVLSRVGTMIEADSQVQEFFGKLSVGNLGTCGDNSELCSTTKALQARKISPGSSLEVREMTALLGTLDGVALVVFLLFSLIFRWRLIPRREKMISRIQLRPSDFTVQVCYLPRQLPNKLHHENYEMLLKQHFEGLIREKFGEDVDAVQEVSLVRDYKGKLSKRIKQGKHLMLKHDLQVREMQTGTNLSKKIQSIDTSIGKLVKKMGDDEGNSEENRQVCTAFVTFKYERYKEAILYKYRFAESWLFRYFQKPKLRFENKCIKVIQACEPSDLYWENLDYGYWKQLLRRCVLELLTIAIVVGCLAIMVYCKNYAAPSQAETPAVEIWVIKPLDGQCLSICDWRMFEDPSCQEPGGGLTEIAEVLYFDGGLTTVRDQPQAHPAVTACTDRWESSSCAGATANASAPSWIGVKFSNPHQVKCMEFSQPAANPHARFELFACSASNGPGAGGTSGQEDWRPEERCAGMQDLLPLTEPDGASAPSGFMLVEGDPACSASVAYDAALFAKNQRAADFRAMGYGDEDALWKAGTEDSTVNCYCKQQQSEVGYAQFRAPTTMVTSASAAQELCEEWIMNQNKMLALLMFSVMSVVILNQALVVICQYFSLWERHKTVTDLTRSQFLKLFVVQFLITAILILLVNANLRGQVDDLPLLSGFVSVLRFGAGAFHDFETTWFSAVGAGICLTIALQIVSNIVSPVFMTKVVNPLLLSFFSRQVATQRRLNQLYVLPEWNLSLRLAESTNVIFVIVMYSGGMPLLNIIGLVYAVSAYWVDKWSLLKGSKQPPAYSAQIVRLAISLFPIAAFLHTLISLWMFGNQSLFPSDWSPLQTFVGSFIGMTESKYDAVMEAWLVGSESDRDQLFTADQYIGARALDTSRAPCVLLFLVFVVLAVCFALAILSALLKPFIMTLLICFKGCCKSAKSDTDAEVDFDQAQEMRKGLQILFSYRLEKNPRYSALLALQGDSEQEVENAVAQAGVIEEGII